MHLILRTYDLKLKHRFTISRQSFQNKRTLIIELADENISGYGEASENPYYHITIDQMIQDALKHKALIEELSGLHPEQFWQKLFPLFKNNMFVLCALDIAYQDLHARKKRKKLFELWGYQIENNVLSNFTIGIDSVENMLLKMKETPWPIYKIKLGTKDDLRIVKELRKHSQAIFRIDANCAWGVEETLTNAVELKKLGVEFLEQPLAAEDIEGGLHVFKHSALPIMADESCQTESDVIKCKGMFHGINIKLVKCGGLTPAKRMINQARDFNMKIMVGCMTESSVGISAIAHLLPKLDYVDMDGAMLLSQDIAQGVDIEKGKVTYSEQFGTGVTLNDIKPLQLFK